MHLLEIPYYLGLSLKRSWSLKNRRRLPAPVISIGNLTLGGTGKTPATISLAEEAKGRGFLPVILTRGYRGSAKGPCFVSTGKGPVLSVEEAGDEPFLMAEKLEDVPIIKGPDRFESGSFAIRHFEGSAPEFRRRAVFILDDGYQHWRLSRDRDILLVDAANPFGNGKMVPFGRLREPLAAANRADLIVIVLSGRQDSDETTGEIMKELRRHNETAPVYLAERVPSALRLSSGEKRPLAWLSGKKVFGFCGIGNPGSFHTTLRSAGATLTGFNPFRDHYPYDSRDLASIVDKAARSGAEWIATTEKDIMKLRRLDLPGNILIIEVTFSFGKGFFESVFGLLKAAIIREDDLWSGTST